MEVVEYERQYCREATCPNCGMQNFAFVTSGMSEAFPHFYCSDCPNVMYRLSDKELIYKEGATSEILALIVSSLPRCDCGGTFKDGNDPKCKNCKSPFTHGGDPVARLTDWAMILIDGAVRYDDDGPKYKVKILDY